MTKDLLDVWILDPQLLEDSTGFDGTRESAPTEDHMLWTAPMPSGLAIFRHVYIFAFFQF